MGKKKNNRRSFLKTITLSGLGAAAAPSSLLETPPATNTPPETQLPIAKRRYNTPYTGEHLNRIAFPIGGMGAGMFCLEGAGALSHMSIRHRPEIYNEPPIFAALSIKGIPNGARVLEGPVPTWKYFGP
ncbi:twin-arginine translocation signal domain-containing protein, partial [Puia sp.]|uniref:twin-arginine translocation signal domain-containing protein n=1 Tax=Puia sp. TaxID=2045100 RepID=UPI002F41C2D5